jgi:formate/nitrite transporter
MEQPRILMPKETAAAIETAFSSRANIKLVPTLLLAVLAGLFIAFGAQASSLVAHNIDNAGLARVVAGAVFPVGLMMVVLTGSELFTGNNWMVLPLLSRKLKPRLLLRNWGLAYIGNLIGALLMVVMIAAIGQWGMSGGALGAAVIRTAVNKVNLDPLQMIVSGVLCNMLVLLAVWLATAARDGVSRLLACFFPIFLFVVSGFEHSIANMYFIPAGLIAKGTTLYADLALASGFTQAQLDSLTWSGFAYNITFVTLGNVIGGALIATVAWACYARGIKAK